MTRWKHESGDVSVILTQSEIRTNIDKSIQCLGNFEDTERHFQDGVRI